MNFEILNNCHGDTPQKRLILLFAGWSMSARPFAGLTMPGYDIAVAWDYRDMSAPWLKTISDYEEIVLVAWSFGVHAVTGSFTMHLSILHEPGLPGLVLSPLVFIAVGL